MMPGKSSPSFKSPHSNTPPEYEYTYGRINSGYPAETTEAFCDGHIRAFAFFGGVPQSILYDNLWTPPAQGDLFGVGGVECTNLSGLLLERSCPWP
jgi:hypothetical protein